jgi:hypothetical protein
VVESYFRIESALAEEMMGALTPRVELASVGSVLRLYAKALSGRQVLVQPIGALIDRNIGWAAEAATTDGLSIFLPPAVGLFGDERANFQVYKVYTTHQAGRLEFGSFRYHFGADGEYLRSTALDRERRRLEVGEVRRATPEDRPRGEGTRSSPAVTSVQRLFDLFEDRRLALQLFALVEDTRIDACVCREYPGVRPWLRRLQEREAGQRPDVQRMALRQAFVENLLRASLGQPGRIRWPAGLTGRLARAVATLRVVERSGATVQDSAEAASVLYDLAMSIPNLPPQRVPGEWVALDEEAVSQAPAAAGFEPEADREALEGKEAPYQSPEQPGYRGDFKPELVQLLDELADPERTADGEAPLTREQLLELLESSAEI